MTLGDPLDREMQRTAERHAAREREKNYRLSFGDYALFVLEAIGALVPLGLAVATGRLKLGTLGALVFIAAIIGGFVWAIRSLRRFHKRLNERRHHG